MSRLGKKPIIIPSGVTVRFTEGELTVEGPKGKLSYYVRPEIDIKVAEGQLETEIKIDTKRSLAFWGLTVSVIKNMIKGVTEGYEKKLELIGVGYRATSAGPRKVSLAVGFSHPVEFEASEGIEITVEGNKDITIKGIDKQLVGLTAAQIRKVRKPEPYKGKGIKYSNEVVRRKPGKTGKAGA